MKRFIYGFDVMGTFSQGGLFPQGEKMAKPASAERPFTDAASRFDTRAKSSGWIRGDALWTEALSQVEKGWLDAPIPLVSSAGSLYLGADRVNAAFRFAVIQMDNVRACDDLKYGCVNLACATRTPITLPTWDHIGQICLDVAETDQP